MSAEASWAARLGIVRGYASARGGLYRRKFAAVRASDGKPVRELVWADDAAAFVQSVSALTADVARLRAELQSLVDLYAREGESNVERFERVAQMFHNETGLYAPGKDVAAAAYDGTSYEDRVKRWEDWYADRAARARAALAAREPA